MFTYGQLKSEVAKIEAQCDQFGAVLQSFPKNAIGLTPDHIKATEQYKYARKGYDLAFIRLRSVNQYMSKHFSKEMRADRDARRAERMGVA